MSKKKIKKERKLNHSSWTCVLAMLQRWRRWPTPGVHISTNVVDHSFLLAAILVPRVDRCNVKNRVSKWRASSSSRSVTKRVTASRLEAIARPWYSSFFSKSRPAARPSLKTPARRLLDVTVARWSCASKNIGKERGSPQVKSLSNTLGKTGRCLVGWFYSLAWIFLSSPERFLRGSDRDPRRQTETCEYEPCVNLALRSWNKVEVSTKHHVDGVRVLCLFLLLFVFLFFFFFSFLHF